MYISFCFKLFKIWKLGNFNKLSYPVISLKFKFVIFTRCSQETLLDKADRLGQPYYHSYPFEFYSFQFHINMIRFFNVPNHKLRLNVDTMMVPKWLKSKCIRWMKSVVDGSWRKAWMLEFLFWVMIVVFRTSWNWYFIIFSPWHLICCNL